jgi:hypothetical protein
MFIADSGFCFVSGDRTPMPGMLALNHNKASRFANDSMNTSSHSLECQYSRNQRQSLPSVREVLSISLTES